MITPLISVIIPVYNLESQIVKTLDSVCNQTYENLQIIVVNDGSKDGSLDVCRTYAAKDGRILLIDKANEGVTLARQSGLNVAKGEYIHYLDGGDFMDINAYKRLVEELNKQCFPDVLIFRFYFVTSESSEKSIPYPSDVDSPMKFLKHMWTTQQYNTMWQYIHKRELGESIHFDANITIGEDAYYTSQLIYFAKRISFVEDHLFYYVLDDGPSVIRDRLLSEKDVKSYFLFPQLIDQFMSDKPEYKEVEQELTDLKLQCETILIFRGYLKEMDRIADDFAVAFQKFPELRKANIIRRICKLVSLYRKNRLLYHLLVMYYKRKGKIQS